MATIDITSFQFSQPFGLKIGQKYQVIDQAGKPDYIYQGNGNWVRTRDDSSDVPEIPFVKDNRVPVMATTSSSGGGIGIFAGDAAYSDAPRFTVWNPPAQPSFRDGDDGALTNGLTCNASDVYALWDHLAAKYPGNLTRSLVGTDQSGTYPIYKYVFTPTGGGYETSHIFTSGIHGAESTAIFALYSWARELLSNTPAQMAYARSHCRIVFVPLENPWGFSQNPRQRYNSRGVDINRNFDYRWADYAGAEKGTAPGSEAETQAIMSVLSQYSDAVSYMPMHSLLQSNTPYFYLAYPAYEPFDSVGVRIVIDSLKKPGDEEHWYQNAICNAYNYASKQYGMHSCNPEYSDGKFGAPLGSADMTKAVRWFGNLLNYFSTVTRKANEESGVSPRNFSMTFRNTAGNQILFSNSTYQEITQLSKSVNIPAPGFVHVTGHMRVLHTTPTADIFVCPIVGQLGTEWSNFDQRFIDHHEDQTKITSVNDRYALHFNLCVPVEATSTNAGPLKLGIWAKTSASQAQILYYRMCATYIPTGTGKMTLYGATADVANGMTERWPNRVI